MSEHVLKVELRELRTVRLVCLHKGCKGGVIELAVAALEELQEVECPVCGNDIASGHLASLGKAVEGLIGHKHVRVEFVVPMKD